MVKSWILIACSFQLWRSGPKLNARSLQFELYWLWFVISAVACFSMGERSHILGMKGQK